MCIITELGIPLYQCNTCDEDLARESNCLNITDRTPNEWEVPLEQTEYPEKVSQFWNLLRTARDAVKRAEEDICHAQQGTQLWPAQQQSRG